MSMNKNYNSSENLHRKKCISSNMHSNVIHYKILIHIMYDHYDQYVI